MLVWNSHAFNVTDEPAKLDIWINFEFAAPEEQRYRCTLRRHQRHLEDGPAAFGAEELCAHYVAPAGRRDLSS